MIYVIYQIIRLYLFLYLAPIFNFFMNKNKVQNIYANFMNNLCSTLDNININDRIKINNYHKIDNNVWNLIISNHNSIFDDIILSKLFIDNDIKWLDIRTVSKKSRINLQNYALNIFDMFLVNRKLKEDTNTLNKISYRWRREHKPLQIILFPEGTTFNRRKLSKESSEFLKNNSIREYKNLLFPFSGIFNLLISKFFLEIKNIYDLTIIYKLKDKRLIGEYEILFNLSNPNLEIIINLDRYENKNIDELWLYKLWEKKDALLI